MDGMLHLRYTSRLPLDSILPLHSSYLGMSWPTFTSSTLKHHQKDSNVNRINPNLSPGSTRMERFLNLNTLGSWLPGYARLWWHSVITLCNTLVLVKLDREVWRVLWVKTLEPETPFKPRCQSPTGLKANKINLWLSLLIPLSRVQFGWTARIEEFDLVLSTG